MYETYFSLRELPFSVTPDPRFLYINSNYQEAFATLCYGVQQRKGITVITGPAGTGKTTLVKMFLQNAASTAHISCVLDPHLSFLEILRCTADAFGLPPCGDNRLAIIQQLKEYLLEQLTQDHVVALLLDEAQDLDDQVIEELRLLSDLEHAGTRLLQLVLIGQLELETSLNRASLNHLRQRIALRARLVPLGDEEIRAYIAFRLAAAGYGGAAIFQSAAVQRIAFFSHGVPRLIKMRSVRRRSMRLPKISSLVDTMPTQRYSCRRRSRPSRLPIPARFRRRSSMLPKRHRKVSLSVEPGSSITRRR